MARFKPIHRGLKMLPVDFDRQIAPGTFEHALCYLIDHELDLSAFEARYRNDECGAIRGNKRLDRFTLRGRRKVDGQWKLYCLMHNIEKLAHHGLAA